MKIGLKDKKGIYGKKRRTDHGVIVMANRWTIEVYPWYPPNIRKIREKDPMPLEDPLWRNKTKSEHGQAIKMSKKTFMHDVGLLAGTHSVNNVEELRGLSTL